MTQSTSVDGDNALKNHANYTNANFSDNNNDSNNNSTDNNNDNNNDRYQTKTHDLIRYALHGDGQALKQLDILITALQNTAANTTPV